MESRIRLSALRGTLPLWLLALALLLAGCASGPRGSSQGGTGGTGGGRDGVGPNVPANLAQVPDAQPRIEAIRSTGSTSKPYTVLGRSYVPITDDRPFRERGLASWYGNKFHTQQTASGEPYDMYAMTAAHKTLPLPSYVRVRNPANGREVIVRVNDRGPFHDGRIIDLSYTAALKLDLLRGVAPVEIERITNEDIRTSAWRRDAGAAATMVAAAPSTPLPPVPLSVPAPVTMPPEAPPPPDAIDSLLVRELPPLPINPSTATINTMAALDDTGFWIQLGAFKERAGADALRTRAVHEVPALSTQLRIFSEAGTHRVQAGPFSSRDAANSALAAWQEGLHLNPIVVERR